MALWTGHNDVDDMKDMLYTRCCWCDRVVEIDCSGVEMREDYSGTHMIYSREGSTDHEVLSIVGGRKEAVANLKYPQESDKRWHASQSILFAAESMHLPVGERPAQKGGTSPHGFESCSLTLFREHDRRQANFDTWREEAGFTFEKKKVEKDERAFDDAHEDAAWAGGSGD